MANKDNRIIKVNTAEKMIAIMLMVILTACVGLLLYVGRYNCLNVGDDFIYAKAGQQVWNSTHSVFAMFKYAIADSINMWKTWQGLYFDNMLYAFLLGMFAENGMAFSAYFSLLPLAVCGLMAGIIVFKEVLGMDLSKAVIITIPVILFQIMYTPSPSEGFYWPGSAINHTLTYALFELSFAVWLYIVRGSDKNKLVVAKVMAVCLCVMIGGGSYVSAVPMICVVILMVIYAFAIKSKEKYYLLGLMVFFLVCLGFNVMSPGAKVRQEDAGETYRWWEAILMSFVEAIKYIKNWSAFAEVIILLVLMIPASIESTLKLKFNFKYPWLVTLLTFGIYASQFTPCLYSLRDIGTYRVQNIYRFSLYVLLCANLWYWCGFVVKKIEDGLVKKLESYKFGGLVLLVASVVVIGGFSLFILKTSGDTMTIKSALYSLKSGQFENYYQENQIRKEILTNPEEDEVYIDRFSKPPYLININDVAEDGNWYNVILENYYDKKAIHAK